MSEDKKSLIDLVPDSIDSAVKNITDKPTQNMGTTLADIWYLVFGGISQAAEKRKLKYSYALQEFENELKEKINKIPEDKLIEPDIQVVAPALEAAKYCIEKEELRQMFSNLICNSLNEDYCNNIHPLYTHIIKSLSPLDAKILIFFYDHNHKFASGIDFANINSIAKSIEILEKLGLVEYEHKYTEDYIISTQKHKDYTLQTYDYSKMAINQIPNTAYIDAEDNITHSNPDLQDPKMQEKCKDFFASKIRFTTLGINFIITCLFE